MSNFRSRLGAVIRSSTGTTIATTVARPATQKPTTAALPVTRTAGPVQAIVVPAPAPKAAPVPAPAPVVAASPAPPARNSVIGSVPQQRYTFAQLQAGQVPWASFVGPDPYAAGSGYADSVTNQSGGNGGDNSVDGSFDLGGPQFITVTGPTGAGNMTSACEGVIDGSGQPTYLIANPYTAMQIYTITNSNGYAKLNGPYPAIQNSGWASFFKVLGIAAIPLIAAGVSAGLTALDGTVAATPLDITPTITADISDLQPIATTAIESAPSSSSLVALDGTAVATPLDVAAPGVTAVAAPTASEVLETTWVVGSAAPAVSATTVAAGAAAATGAAAIAASSGGGINPTNMQNATQYDLQNTNEYQNIPQNAPLTPAAASGSSLLDQAGTAAKVVGTATSAAGTAAKLLDGSTSNTPVDGGSTPNGSSSTPATVTQGVPYYASSSSGSSSSLSSLQIGEAGIVLAVLAAVAYFGMGGSVDLDKFSKRAPARREPHLRPKALKPSAPKPAAPKPASTSSRVRYSVNQAAANKYLASKAVTP